jgi:hypothetical protein
MDGSSIYSTIILCGNYSFHLIPELAVNMKIVFTHKCDPQWLDNDVGP